MKHLSRLLQLYYLLGLLLLALGVIGTLYFYFNSKLMDTEHSTRINDSLNLIESLKKDSGLEEVMNLVESDKVRLAVKQYDIVEQKLLQITTLNNSSSNQELIKKSDELKESLNQLLNYPESGNLLAVFNNKLASVHQFISGKGWKTLGRMSERLKNRFGSMKDFSITKIDGTRNTLNANVQMMRKIAETSTLAQEDKNRLFSHMDQLQSEIAMLNNYANQLKDFKERYKEFRTDYDRWLQGIAPELKLETMLLKKKSNLMVVLLVSLIVLSVLLMILGILVYRFTSLRSRGQVEKKVLEMVQTGLLAQRPQWGHEWSDDFIFEMQKSHHYVQKRMSFSSLFQLSMPFPAILLNANLKLIWANASFNEAFKITETNYDKENISWDYLSRYTNLGEQNPVLDSLRDKMAGIFQIQIKAENTDVAIPYEMYVCPAFDQQNPQKYVMVYFYPLSSMNDTIHNQVLSLLNPIKKAVSALKDNEWNDHFRESVSPEFREAGIGDIWDSFEKLNDLTNRQKNVLIEDITRLEADLADNFKLLADIEMQNKTFKKLQMEMLDNLRGLREHLISYVDVNNSQLNISDEIVALYKSSLLYADDLYKIATSNLQKIEETQEVLLSLEKVKEGLRPIKENIQLLNNRLLQGVDKALSSADVVPLTNSLGKLKNDVDLISTQIKDFSNILKFIDLKLSKVSMILKNDEESVSILRNFEQESLQFENKIDETFYEKSRMIRDGQVLEDKMVKSIEDFFITFKKNIAHLSAVNDLMNKHMNSDQEQRSITYQQQ